MKIFGKTIGKKSINDMTIENVGMHAKAPTQTGFGLHTNSQGPEVSIDEVYANQRLYDSVLAFSVRTLCDENITFLKQTQYSYENRMAYLIRYYIADTAPKLVNVSGVYRQAVLAEFHAVQTFNLAAHNTQHGHHNGQALSATNVGGAFKRRGPKAALNSAFYDLRTEVESVASSDVLANYRHSEEYKMYMDGV